MTRTNSSVKGERRLRIGIGLAVSLIGFLMFALGADPNLFGLDRSPMTGYLQILVFLIGLAILCIGGYLSLNSLWNGFEKTIAADIGVRLVGTGYVIAVASGMSDLLGFGSNRYPNLPYFGPWQTIGVLIGLAVIAVGFILIIPFRRTSKDQPKIGG